MTRLTIASLTATLASQGISLTGKSGAYVTVIASGYSTTHKTLAEVQTYVEGLKYAEGESYSDRENLATVSQEGSISAYDSYFATVEKQKAQQLADDLAFDKQIEEENEMNIQTEPTEAEAYCTQSTRRNQLYSYAQNRGVDLEFLSMADTTMKEDEEEIGAELTRQADERKAYTHVFNFLPDHTERAMLDSISTRDDVICRGFATNTPRVSAKLQRRANKFFALLATAA